MANHMLLMSFNTKSLMNLHRTLNRFFEYMLILVKKNSDIRFCYIGTARDDKFLDNFFFKTFMRTKFGRRIKTSCLILSKKSITEQEIENHLRAQDVIFIGGGNTKKMLHIWENTRFISILNKLKAEDALPILAGVSAGGMYPFHSGLSYSLKKYIALACLGWIPNSFCAHANSKVKAACDFNNNKVNTRMDAFKEAIALKKLPPGYAVPDDCMLHFYNNNLVRALSSRKNENCFYVSEENTKSIDTIHLTKHNILKLAA